MFEITKSFCDSFLDYGVPGFDLAVYQNGACILRHKNGFSDVENQIPVQGNERYYIYSCSKPITCTAALQLYEKGLFSLEDKLSDYMPEFAKMTVQTGQSIKRAENPIRIKHLFEMTAGFSYNLWSPQLKKAFAETEGRCPTREVMKYLAEEPLLFEPGERFEYSLCHDVLAALVEVISGKKFNDYVTENVFLPLGMKDSTYVLDKDGYEALSEEYQFVEETKSLINLKKKNEFILGSEYESGGAGCVSTVDEYMKFLEGLRTYKVLKKETVELMATDRLTGKQKETFSVDKRRYGYGLGVRCPNQNGFVSDFGWDGAAGAYLAVDIKNGISVYLGMHLRNPSVRAIRGKVYDLICAELYERNKIPEIFAEIKELGFPDMIWRI